MKKTAVQLFVAFILVGLMIIGQVKSSMAETSDEDTYADTDKFAHNIYSDPDLSETSGAFHTFTIDFYGEQTPCYTYWALANFGMSISDATKARYSGITGGGAYAGLQHRSPGDRVGILSFWEYFYQEGGEQKSLRATRIFPEGSNNFGGEGEGTNCIWEYNWKDQSWYRMVLHCWEDLENGTTFVGQWFCDLSTGEWTLLSYFDTHLYDATFQGMMSLFQENYISGIDYWSMEREFHVKNMYVNDAKDGLWQSIPSTTLLFGYDQTNKMGAASFGVGEDVNGEYFWGRSGGLVPNQGQGNYIAPQEAFHETALKSGYYSISQPEQPTFGSPSLDSLTLTEENGTWTASWTSTSTSTPQLSYKVEVFDEDGVLLFVKEATRPEETSVVLEGVMADSFQCRITIQDIFGSQTILTETKEPESMEQSHWVTHGLVAFLLWLISLWS